MHYIWSFLSLSLLMCLQQLATSTTREARKFVNGECKKIGVENADYSRCISYAQGMKVMEHSRPLWCLQNNTNHLHLHLPLVLDTVHGHCGCAGRRIRRMMENYRKCPIITRDPALASTLGADQWRAQCDALNKAHGGFHEVVPPCDQSGLPDPEPWRDVDNWRKKYGGAGLFIGLLVRALATCLLAHSLTLSRYQWICCRRYPYPYFAVYLIFSFVACIHCFVSMHCCSAMTGLKSHAVEVGTAQWMPRTARVPRNST